MKICHNLITQRGIERFMQTDRTEIIVSRCADVTLNVVQSGPE